MSEVMTQERRTKSKPTSDAHEPAIAPGMTEAEIDSKLEKRESRASALETAKDFSEYSFEVLRVGAEQAIREISVPDALPQTDIIKKLLGDLAVAAVGAASGGVTGWIVGAAATVLKDKAASAVKGAVTAAVSKALHGGTAEAAAQINDLRSSFSRLMDIQYLAAKQRFANEWPEVRAQLNTLSDAELATLNKLSMEHPPQQAYAAIIRSTFAQWANFLARAMHGAGSWDHWAGGTGSKGAIALHDAAPAPSAQHSDPSRGNIAHNEMGWAFEKSQRPMMDEHYGVLEIFLEERTLHVVDHPGYRMRLDNVGPKVREELRQAGRVGDLPVNKLIRICSNKHQGVTVNPPIAKATLLVTADGYIRASSGFEVLHFEAKKGPVWDPSGFGDCMDDLIRGDESQSCHYDRTASASNMRTIAEVAQALPLTYLG